MAKNYIYRMDHDTGFAPHVENDHFCSLSGCKDTTIEVWAEKGSWVIGLGGNFTGKPSKLIYAMRVDENLPFEEFRSKYPAESKYLTAKHAGTNVLVSNKDFYYFGNEAINLRSDLSHIVIDRHGCKCVSNEDIDKLLQQLSKYRKGKLGNPSNQT